MLGCLRSCPQPPCSPEAGHVRRGDLDPVLCSASLECPLPSSQTTRSNPKKTIWKDTETRVNDTLKESSSTLLSKPQCQARQTGQDTPPSPFPSGMLILIQEFPSLPRVPRPSRPCRVTSAARHLVAITRLPVERGVTLGLACAASLGSGWLVHVL